MEGTNASCIELNNIFMKHKNYSLEQGRKVMFSVLEKIVK